MSRIRERSNDEWIAALRGRGDGSDVAVRELESYLRRMIGRVAGPRLGDTDAGELVQESLAAICESLPRFRGDSAFTTWATAVATRVVYTELRRRDAAPGRRRAFEQVERDIEALTCARTPQPESGLARAQLLTALQHAIATQLTEKQRFAVVAELRGVPTVEIAERLGTNQNALYKLHHDARKKLRRALLAAGFTGDSLLEPEAGEKT